MDESQLRPPQSQKRGPACSRWPQGSVHTREWVCIVLTYRNLIFVYPQDRARLHSRISRALDPQAGITYRGALRFETGCELFRETETRIGSTIPATVGRADGEEGRGYPGRDLVREMDEGRSAE